MKLNRFNPNIAQFYKYYKDELFYYIALEYIPGGYVWNSKEWKKINWELFYHMECLSKISNKWFFIIVLCK